MKRSIIIAIAAISMAGAAGTNLLATPSQDAASFQGAAPKVPAGEAPPLASRARLAEPRTVPTAQPAPAPVQRKASLEVRQAPVPLQTKPHPPVNLPAADITEATAKGEVGPSAKAEAVASAPAATSAPSATNDQSSETAVRASIQADGYKGVQVLRKGVNGVWHAKAMRGTTEVLLVVDSSGNVTTGD
jgi:hypothetical protein